MATIRVAIDNCYGYSSDKKTLETFAEKLRAAGHTVTTHGVGPNKIQGVMGSSSNKCDIAIQIAGGKCLGTLCDFYVGVTNGYYHAKKMGFAYYKCYKADWPAKREPRDHFSTRPGPVKVQADRMTGKTLPQIFEIYKDKMVYGYGDNAEDCAKTLLQNINGGTSTDTGTSNGETQGTSILELIKQVCSDLDPYGVELTLTGDTVNIKRTNPNKAVTLNPDMITSGQITFNDYDNSTPNTNGDYKDTYLINRYGVIPMDDIDSSWRDQVLLMAQRGHGHSIELNVVVDPNYVSGRWVKLSLPGLGIYDRPYFITKHSYSDEMVMSLTLEPGPPSLYVEVNEVEDEASVEEDTSTEE